MSLYQDHKDDLLIIRYESGYAFEMRYLDEGTLHWRALAETVGDAAGEGTEGFAYYEIAPGIYNLNWVEEAGVVISQIVDFPSGKVYAFMTWPDEEGRGGRGSLMHKGTLEIAGR